MTLFKKLLGGVMPLGKARRAAPAAGAAGTAEGPFLTQNLFLFDPYRDRDRASSTAALLCDVLWEEAGARP